MSARLSARARSTPTNNPTRHPYTPRLILPSLTHRLYIFDRHCTCTFYASFNGKPPKQGPTTLSNVYAPPLTAPIRDSASTAPTDRSSLGPIAPWNQSTHQSGLLVSQGAGSGDDAGGEVASETKAGLAFDEEAKLVYGIVFSLRNMVNKLAGR